MAKLRIKGVNTGTFMSAPTTTTTTAAAITGFNSTSSPWITTFTQVKYLNKSKQYLRFKNSDGFTVNSTNCNNYLNNFISQNPSYTTAKIRFAILTETAYWTPTQWDFTEFNSPTNSGLTLIGYSATSLLTPFQISPNAVNARFFIYLTNDGKVADQNMYNLTPGPDFIILEYRDFNAQTVVTMVNP